jgi:hypothetical protein
MERYSRLSAEANLTPTFPWADKVPSSGVENPIVSPIAPLVESDEVLHLMYPRAGKPRARKVISRSKTRPTGKYPSWKMKRMLHWESEHELNAFRLLDADPAVSQFAEQPLIVRYSIDGAQHDHYPDIKVVTGNAKELWEVKTLSDASKPCNVRRTSLMVRGLPTHGYAYRLILAEQMSAGPHLTNALTVLRHGRADIPIVERERLRRLLTRIGSIAWGAVIEGALGTKTLAQASRLILEGLLRFDRSALLAPSTMLTYQEKNGVGDAHPSFGQCLGATEGTR